MTNVRELNRAMSPEQLGELLRNHGYLLLRCAAPDQSADEERFYVIDTATATEFICEVAAAGTLVQLFEYLETERVLE